MLPTGEIGVLQRQRGPVRLRAAQKRSVGVVELAEQQADGPAVADNVVHAHYQQMLVRLQAQQGGAEQRSGSERKRLAGQGLGQRLCSAPAEVGIESG